jgi:haloalkane dehalogenase
MAARHPDRIRALVILNTVGFYPKSDADNNKLILPLKLMRAPLIGNLMVRQLGLFERVAMPVGMAKKDRYQTIKAAYRGVFTGPKDRAGVLAFPRLIPDTLEHPSAQILRNEVEPFLADFHGPAIIFWGDRDIAFTAAVLKKWQSRLPQLNTVHLADAKHYVQEDAYEEIVPRLRVFLDELQEFP